MSIGTYEDQRRYSGSAREDWRGYSAPARRRDFAGTFLGLPLAGLAAVGLGALAWYYLGPDLRRYMKIRNM